MRKSKKATETATETTAATTPTVEAKETSTEAMCFTAKRKDLAAHVRRMASIADKKARLKVLSFIALRTSARGVVLAATDLEVYGIVEVPCRDERGSSAWKVDGYGGFALGAKDLGDVLRKLPDGDVTIRVVQTGARVSCAGVEVFLQGIPDRDYPKLPIGGPDSAELATVDAETFGEMIGAVEHAICQDQTRFHMNGISFWYRGTDARMIATDGHRLAKVERNLQRDGVFCTTDKGLILRAKACAAMRKLLDKSGACEIGMDHGMFLCRRTLDGVTTTVFSKPVDSEFPSWERVVPTTNRRLVTVDRAALAGALDRAKDLCTSTRGVKLAVVGDGHDGSGLSVSTDHPDKGTAKEIVGAEFVASLCDGFEIGVNPAYLIDALDGIEDERVTLAFSHDDSPLKGYEKKKGTYAKACELAPMLVRATLDAVNYEPIRAPYLSVVMPMRM